MLEGYPGTFLGLQFLKSYQLNFFSTRISMAFHAKKHQRT